MTNSMRAPHASVLAPHAFEKVVVVGDGGWGTALALVLERAGCEVGLWCHDPEYAAFLARARENPRYLPGFELPRAIAVSADVADLLDRAGLIVSAVPTEHVRAVFTRHARQLPQTLPIVSVSKGLEDGSLERPTEILRQVGGPSRPLAVLSGPNIAREVAKGLPAATVVASEDRALAERIQATFRTPTFRVYVNDDPPGVELGGVLKNVIALAAGMCNGLELGANATAAVVTRGVLEMARLGVAFGGRRETFFGLSGLGDLITTCMSPTSRNRTFGERLGRGERPADIAAGMHQVAEGVKSARPVHDLARKHGLELPISTEVYRVLHEGRSPRESVAALMARVQRDESEHLT